MRKKQPKAAHEAFVVSIRNSMEKVSKTTSPRKTFTDYLRLWFKWVLDPLGGFLNRLGLTPNMVTGLGLLGNIVGAIYLARGEMLTGGIWIALMTPVDALDGTMARLRGESSDFGAFVDSVSDRYSELIIYGGLLYHFLKLGEPLGGLLRVKRSGAVIALILFGTCSSI